MGKWVYLLFHDLQSTVPDVVGQNCILMSKALTFAQHSEGGIKMGLERQIYVQLTWLYFI